MNKKELVDVIEYLEHERCFLRRGSSCNMDCSYRISACYGDECLFDVFAEALSSDDKIDELLNKMK